METLSAQAPCLSLDLDQLFNVTVWRQESPNQAIGRNVLAKQGAIGPFRQRPIEKPLPLSALGSVSYRNVGRLYLE
jgi:hypothetical protein